MNDVQMSSLTTPSINAQMPGLASHSEVENAARISFTQLETQIHGNLSVTGNLTVSGTGGGSTVDLSPYQHHPSAHLAAYGAENYYAGEYITINPDNQPLDPYLSWGNTHFLSNDTYHTYPDADANAAYVEFNIPVNAKSCLAHIRQWNSSGYCDVFLVHANGTQIWANRLEFFGYAGAYTLDGTVVNNSRMVVVAAGHIDGPFSRIRFQGRKGSFTIMSVAYQDHILPQPPAFVHSDNIIGNPASLSDKRLKEEIDPVSGTQALSILSQIQGCTYDREDLDQRRLGLIAEKVESAIEELAIDNVVSSKWHRGQDYKTLDYSRLVNLLIPAVNKMAQEIQVLKSILNGTSS